MKNKNKPFIIPIFLPHAACPNTCLFCNQRALHPEEKLFDFSRLEKEILRWAGFARNPSRPLELAFYGGNFLGLPESFIGECLEFVDKNFPGAAIRFSTRPDSISEKKIRLFTEKKMRPVVELGIQSLDDAVLLQSLRGHRAEDTFRAVHLLRERDVPVVAQMMLGLPGASPDSDLASVRELSRLPIHGARLSPTLVLKGSGLAKLHGQGKYVPLGFEDAVRLCAASMAILESAGIPVIRMGLQTDGNLEKNLLAGPHHPAFGEWVRSYDLRQKVLAALHERRPFHGEEEVCIRVSHRLMGRMRGMGKQNERFFAKAVFPARISIVSDRTFPSGVWLLEKKTKPHPKKRRTER